MPLATDLARLIPRGPAALNHGALMFVRRLLSVLFLLGLLTQRAVASDAQAWVNQHLDELVAFYRELHTHPELSFHEEQTARRLAESLRKVDAEVTTGVGGHGVVALLKNGPGPTLMLRTDMDALPVRERTELVYASQVRTKNDQGVEVGVMHACGHDIHMTNLIGVARYLAEHRDRWSGTVMFVCQGAEERGAGAKAMLDDGLFKRFPKPDMALALHVDSTLATGRIGYRAGFSLANVDSVDITMRGRGGHGAYPQATIDPIVEAALLVVDLQTIVSREISPTEPAVITVGSIHGGTKHNVIGDSCHLQLTVRSYSDKVRKHLIAAIRRKARAVAEGAAAEPPIIKVGEGTPALYNAPDLVKRVLPALERVVGADNVVPSEPVMGGEDFSRYGRAGVPIFMYRLGSVSAQRLKGFQRFDRPPPSLHSAEYYPDAEATLRTGVLTMSAAVLDLLSPKSNDP